MVGQQKRLSLQNIGSIRQQVNKLSLNKLTTFLICKTNQSIKKKKDENLFLA